MLGFITNLLGGFNLKIGLFIFALLAAGGLYFYVNGLQNTIKEMTATVETLTHNIAVKDMIIHEKDILIMQKETDIQHAQEIYVDLEKKFRGSELDKAALRRRLAGLNTGFKDLQKLLSETAPKGGLGSLPIPENQIPKQLDANGNVIENPVLVATENLEVVVNLLKDEMIRCNLIVTGSPISPEDSKNEVCPESVKLRKGDSQ